MATVPISQRGKLRPQPHVCSLDLECCSPLRQEWPRVKGVLPAEGVSLQVSWPSVGLSILGCGRSGQTTPLVRAQLPSGCTVYGPLRRREPALTGATPIKAEPLTRTVHNPRRGGSLSLRLLLVLSGLTAFAQLLRSPLRAPHRQIIPHLHTHPSHLISLCDHSVPGSRDWVCPVPTQRAFQNSVR